MDLKIYFEAKKFSSTTTAYQILSVKRDSALYWGFSFQSYTSKGHSYNSNVLLKDLYHALAARLASLNLVNRKDDEYVLAKRKRPLDSRFA